MSNLIKLKKSQHKQWLYKQEPLVINDYEIDEENIHLSVTRAGKVTNMMVPNQDAAQFFDDLLPVGDGYSAKQLTVYQSQQSSLTTLRQQLMELNTKLSGEDGDKYIKQAKAINNNINTLLNSLKLELAVSKEINKAK